jgi:DNA-binding NtrC family response regulator
MMPHRQHVLIVDDEQDFARGLSRLAAELFPDVLVAQAFSGAEALEYLRAQRVDVLITDLRMPGMTGLQLVPQALEQDADLSVVVLTAHGSIESAVEALRAGAYDFMSKPVEPDQLARVLGKGLERSRLLAENRRLRDVVSLGAACDDLVGQGQAMQALRRTIATVAQSDYTVLVRGESGTGKEMVARTIHRQSPRSAMPFLAVNCPAIPEHLLESELFGHVRGAFTGAERDRKGLFAMADGGTVHLDEIGDISQPIQTKLLRFLQEGEIRPVGSGRTENVDVRVVASTNQDLEARMASREFREDLFYRLNVVTIRVPPLRERVEDIPLLVVTFLRNACDELGLPQKTVAPEVLDHLAGRDWPGNVRELQNVVRRLTLFSGGEVLGMDTVRHVAAGGHGRTGDWLRTRQADAGGREGTAVGNAPGMGQTGGAALPGDADRAGAGGTPGASVPGGNTVVPYKAAKARVTDQFTQGYLRDLLAQTGGNVSEAARLSGLSRVAIQKMVARLGMDVGEFRG